MTNTPPTPPTPPNTPSAEFLAYNEGKLDVVDGHVHLTAAGWAEYGPSFSTAGMVLRDKLPLDEFRRDVRQAARACMQANDVALRAELNKLETPVEDKQFIRELLNDQPKTANAAVLPFPGPRAKRH